MGLHHCLGTYPIQETIRWSGTDLQLLDPKLHHPAFQTIANFRDDVIRKLLCVGVRFAFE